MIIYDEFAPRSDGSLVGDVLIYIVHVVLVFAIVVFAASHEVKKARNVDVYLLLVRKAAFRVFEFALSQRVINAGFAAEVVGKTTLVALGAVVVVI